MVLRPDEEAMQSNIEREKRFSENVKSGASTALSLGGTALGAAGFTKVLPFLSEYLTPSLAMKGISKVSPKLGDFLKRGTEAGLDLKEGLQFIKDKISSSRENQPEQENIIKKYSQTLFDHISGLIDKGTSPAEAASMTLKALPNEKEAIKKMEKDYKTDWFNIVESIFGRGEKAQAPQQMQQAQQPQQMAQQMQQPQQDQAQGNWNQIAAMLQKTLAS